MKWFTCMIHTALVYLNSKVETFVLQQTICYLFCDKPCEHFAVYEQLWMQRTLEEVEHEPETACQDVLCCHRMGLLWNTIALLQNEHIFWITSLGQIFIEHKQKYSLRTCFCNSHEVNICRLRFGQGTDMYNRFEVGSLNSPVIMQWIKCKLIFPKHPSELCHFQLCQSDNLGCVILRKTLDIKTIQIICKKWMLSTWRWGLHCEL